MTRPNGTQIDPLWPEPPGSDPVSVHLPTPARAERALMDAAEALSVAQATMERVERTISRLLDTALQAHREQLSVPRRSQLQRRLVRRLDRLERVVLAATHRGTRLLDGSLTAGVTFIMPGAGGPRRQVSLAIPDCRSAALGLAPGLGLASAQEAGQTVAAVRRAATLAQARWRELEVARQRLLAALDQLSYPTQQELIQLHTAAVDNVRRLGALVQAGDHEAAAGQLTLVRTIFDLIVTLSRAISPDDSGNIQRLVQLLGQRLAQACQQRDLTQLNIAVTVLRDLHSSWEEQANRPLISGAGGRARRRRPSTAALVPVAPAAQLGDAGS